MAQTAAKIRRQTSGKPALTVPPEVEEAEPEGPAPEPTDEDIAILGEIPQLSSWQAEGGPSREKFCKASLTALLLWE